ncbi:MAG: CapA family protein [Iphinoe sp. HA4291-MV1]|jgi:poly-gamma-glutamate capsule biosynthesis protein CapA/YwtB (metallophosphatase superfamily)|nr:CapA family protein [Iphinoe sp. HA4291-MV1]
MVNQKLGKLLSFGFISFCFCLGIGIGLFMRFGQLQRTNASTKSTDTEPIPFSIPEYTSPDTITIQAVGDVIPGTNYPHHRLPRNPNLLLPNSVRVHLQRADILFGNFESSLTNYPYSAKDISKGQIFAFRSPPTYAQLFADVGFDVMNIANNHALDFGSVGFQDTVKNLKAAGIKTLGHKNQILLLKVKNIPVAMIGFAPYEFYNSIHDLKTAKTLVQKAKTQANVVIVSMHAGSEGTNALQVQNKTEFFYGENRGNSLQFARTMIDAGADLVLGHGPHVPRATEIYNGKLIAYSLGNFLGYRTLSTAAETGYSMILEVKLNSQGDFVFGKIIPVHLDAQGIPHFDKRFRTVGLLRYLNNKDFPNNPAKINKKGEIVVAEKE